jgi:hypothetical protein
MDMDLTSPYGSYGRMDMDIGRANPIRKDVAANRPNWLPEGVVTAIHLRQVIHLPVAPEGVFHCCCRWRLP